LFEHIAHMEKMHVKFWLENLEGTYQLEEQGVDGMMILKWILNK